MSAGGLTRRHAQTHTHTNTYSTHARTQANIYENTKARLPLNLLLAVNKVLRVPAVPASASHIVSQQVHNATKELSLDTSRKYRCEPNVHDSPHLPRNQSPPKKSAAAALKSALRSRNGSDQLCLPRKRSA